MDLELTDRVFIVTGGPAGSAAPPPTCLVAEGARVVLSGRSRGVARRRRRGARRRRRRPSSPTTPTRPPRAPDRRGQRHWGRLDGALISVGGPPDGPVTGVTDEQWTAASSRSSSARSGSAARSARQLAARRLAGAGAVVERARAAAPTWRSPTGCGPGLAMVAKTLADELGPAGVRVNGLLPGRVGTERVAELDARDRRRRGGPSGGGRRRSRWAATASRRSSAGSRRSCCRRRRRSSPARWCRSTAACCARALTRGRRRRSLRPPRRRPAPLVVGR